ncbi:MAG: amidohydrolase [Akkermansiaceae bacterium]|nr:amidohydrolase [Akkermansiaceae bacterium]
MSSSLHSLPIPSATFDRIVEVRRDLHQHPELSWKEQRTTERVCGFLGSLGLECDTSLAPTGVVTTLPGRDSSHGIIALRADIDALPIHEETGLPFASRHAGVMHACGHDGHTSSLLGAAALLAAEDELPVPVRLIFQPAEETGEGARALIETGVLDDVTMIFGGHIDRGYPLGSIIVTDGHVNASSDRFKITIAGKGGHAGRPHEATDAVVVGSLLVMALQTIVSREINPAHPSVVTVGRFEAGNASNVIAEHACLRGTIRAQDPGVRVELEQSIRRVSTAVGALHDARVDVEIQPGTPAVINDRTPTELARHAAAQVVGDGNVRPLEHANMGAEDFGWYARDRPACYVRFGTSSPGHEFFPAHSSRFDFDERTLAVAAAYYHRLAIHAGQHLIPASS